MIHGDRFSRFAEGPVEHIFTRAERRRWKLILVDQFAEPIDGLILKRAKPFLRGVFDLWGGTTVIVANRGTRHDRLLAAFTALL